MCVGGPSGDVLSHCRGTILRLQLAAANQRRDETMVSVGSKAYNESKDGKDVLLFGEVVGTWLVTIARKAVLNGYWGLCY